MQDTMTKTEQQIAQIMAAIDPRSDVATRAALLRKALRLAYPGITFSVRISRYSMGSSIRVGWLDGPTVSAVEALTTQAERVYRDEMTGEILNGGNSFVDTNREVSGALVAHAVAWMTGYLDAPGVRGAVEYDFNVRAAIERRDWAAQRPLYGTER